VDSHNLFYDSAVDDDRLELSATLKRDDVELFTRGRELHWWLTGFKWGVISDPSQLSVDLSIKLKDDAMRDAFLTGIDGRAYTNLKVDGQCQGADRAPVAGSIRPMHKVCLYNSLVS
jgi:hypothetical protein